MLVGTLYLDNLEEKENILDDLLYGAYVLVEGELIKPYNNTIPNNFNYKSYLSNKMIYYQLKIDNIKVIKESNNIIYKLKNKINKRILKIDKTGYLKAFILGDNSLIDDMVYESYQSIGITHLFALSGMHVSLLSGIILKGLKKVNNKLKYLIVIIVLISYGFIVGYPASIKRAITFFIIASINKIFNFKLSTLKILFITVFILIFLNYKIIYDIGFLYSVITVFGIFWGSNFIKSENIIYSSFKLSLVAFLFSLPITLACFYEINILSIIYNMFYIPFVSVILYPFCLLTFILPFLEKILVLLIKVMENISLFLNNIDFFKLYLDFNIGEILLFYILLLVILRYNRFKYFILLFLIVFIDLMIPYLDSSLYVYYLDVGQGDSSLIITPHLNEVILIDTGGKLSFDTKLEGDKSYVSEGTLSLLRSLGINKIDYLILTHGDYDHMGDAIYLVNNIKINKVIFNCGEYNDLEKELMEVLEQEKINYYTCINELDINKNKIYFLNSDIYDNENDNSNVTYFNFYNHNFLFMGDAGIDKEKYILDNYNLENIDFFKVGHHGSKTSSSKEFVNMINPKYSLVSVGRNNRYGHPNEEVLDILRDSKIYRTDENGTIKLQIKNNKVNINLFEP